MAKRQKLRELYLDYFNNFLTVAAFADYYGFQQDAIAHRVIKLGRLLHENHAAKIKQELI